ncbi:MAG: hypothetical protein E7G47_13700 [Clostridium perfringens]|nr:hypothetical protein [Clostridium perfringens]
MNFKLSEKRRCCLNCTYLYINYTPSTNDTYRTPDKANRNIYINDVNKLLDLQTKPDIQGYTVRNEHVKCYHDVWDFQNKPYFGLFEKPNDVPNDKYTESIFKERSKILKKIRLKGSCPFNNFNSYQSLEGTLQNMKFRAEYKDHKFNRNKEYILLIVTISTLMITIFNTFLKTHSTMYIKLLK